MGYVNVLGDVDLTGGNGGVIGLAIGQSGVFLATGTPFGGQLVVGQTPDSGQATIAIGLNSNLTVNYYWNQLYVTHQQAQAILGFDFYSSGSIQFGHSGVQPSQFGLLPLGNKVIDWTIDGNVVTVNSGLT